MLRIYFFLLSFFTTRWWLSRHIPCFVAIRQCIRKLWHFCIKIQNGRCPKCLLPCKETSLVIYLAKPLWKLTSKISCPLNDTVQAMLNHWRDIVSHCKLFEKFIHMLIGNRLTDQLGFSVVVFLDQLSGRSLKK